MRLGTPSQCEVSAGKVLGVRAMNLSHIAIDVQKRDAGMRSREQQVLLVIAGILVVTSALGALKFRRERDTVRSTLTAYAATLPLSLARPSGAPVPRAALEALGQIRDHIAEGQYTLASEQLEEIASKRPRRAQTPAGGREPRPPGPGPSPHSPDGGLGMPLGPGQSREGTQVSPEAREFFDEHPELYRRARALAGALIAGRRQGADLGDAPELLKQTIEAAEEGDDRKVADLVRRAERALGGPPAPSPHGGEPGRAPARSPESMELEQKVARFQQAAQKAQAEGRDISVIAAISAKIRDAMAEGNRELAGELIDQATAKLMGTKPVARRPGPRQGQRPARGAARGGEPRPPDARMATARRVVETLMATMNQEQDALNKARASLADAQLALREKNQDQVRDILRTASVELDGIERGRRALVERQTRPGRPAGSADTQSGPRPRTAGLRESIPVPFVKPREAMAHIGDAFDKVRTLSVDQYAEGKRDLTFALFGRVVIAPKQPDEKPEPDSSDSVPVTEELVRHKLQMAEGPYRAAEASGDAKAGEAQKLLAEARRLLYEEKYAEASEALDRVLEVLGVEASESAT